MWSENFNTKLLQWHQLKNDCRHCDLVTCLKSINQWWLHTPWCAYYLHWDDEKNWPDPWQLLENQQFCALARGLGILYTISMIDREDLQDAILVDHGADNLVQVHGGKYILNWNVDDIVNIRPDPMAITRSVSQQVLKSKIY